MSTVDHLFPIARGGTPGAYAAVWNPVQTELAARVRVEPIAGVPRYIAGADCAFSPDKRSIVAVALVWDRVGQQVIEQVAVVREVTAPYISGYLSFREGPAVLEAVGRLTHPFDVLCIDGQGIAHPRRCGLATHVGVVLDRPTIGVAKSRLIGTFTELPVEAGSHVPLVDRGEPVGIVLRTRPGVSPLFVSVGHRVDLPTAIACVLGCVTRYRVPEPTRQADRLVAIEKRKLPGNSPRAPGE